MSLRDDLNGALPGRIDPALKEVGLGDAVNALLAAATFTETGVVPSSNVGTLANVPQTLWRVKATAETGTVHEKAILKGPISGTGAIVPPAGSCVWLPGQKKILFNAADAVTAFSALYAQSADQTVSLLQRTIGQQDHA